MTDKAVSDAAWEAEHGPTERREHTEEWFAKRGLVLRTRAEWEALTARLAAAEADAAIGRYVCEHISGLDFSDPHDWLLLLRVSKSIDVKLGRERDALLAAIAQIPSDDGDYWSDQRYDAYAQETKNEH